MEHQGVQQTSVLDYATPKAVEKPRRLWVLFAFLTAVAVGELVLVPRLYRWQWPMPGDYLLLGLLFAGALTMSICTSLPGWLIGTYGLVGLCFFQPGQAMTRAFRFGIAEHGAVPANVAGWSCALIVTWIVCRSSVVLRRWCLRNHSRHLRDQPSERL